VQSIDDLLGVILESCISRNLSLTVNYNIIPSASYDSSQNQGVILIESDLTFSYAVPDRNGEKTMHRDFLRRGNLAYDLNSLEFLKAAGFLIYLPILTLACKVLIPVFVYKPVVFLSNIFKNVQWLKNTERNLSIVFRAKTARPFRALAAIIAHVAIGILALTPPFSNFFNKLNGDLERWVNGSSTKDIQEKSIETRLKENLFIVPCQQPLFYIESPGTKLSYSDLSCDTNLYIFKVLKHEKRFTRTLETCRNWFFANNS
jgi:hypothetical protein